MKLLRHWPVPALLILSFTSSDGQNVKAVPTIENDVLRISASIADASLTVIDKRTGLEWHQQSRLGVRLDPESSRVTPTSLSATLLGRATYALTISLDKE